jgi:hypothetical protein
VRLAFALAALLAAAPRVVHACAGCRNPSMPITRIANVHLAPGQVRASAAASVTTLNVVHEAGCADVNSCAEVPVQPRYLHDQDLWPAELRAIAEVGLTSAWGAEVQLPFRLTRTTIRYSSPDGQPYTPLDPDVHHRNETVAGIGDPWLTARYGTTLAGTLVTARLGTTLPLGRTEADPFALGARGERHQHIQFGNGTFDPLLALDVSRSVGRLQLSGYGQAQVTLYENGKGFRAGNRYFVGVQGGTRLFGTTTGALGIDAIHDGAERWGGRIQQDGNLGRTELLVGVSVTHTFGRNLLSVLVRAPVYRHIVTGEEPPGKLSSPLTLSLVASRTF